jgi:hypothetical protein
VKDRLVSSCVFKLQQLTRFFPIRVLHAKRHYEPLIIVRACIFRVIRKLGVQ